MVVNGIFEPDDLSQKSYSTITVDEVEFDDDEGILGPVPPKPLGGPHPGVDPQGLVDPENPLNGDDAYVLAIHAIDPEVNRGGPKGPGGADVPNKKVALNTIIGLRVLAPGPEYTDVEVPIFRTPQIIKKFGLGADKRLPPDGSNGGAEVAATLWFFINLETPSGDGGDGGLQPAAESDPELESPFVPLPLELDGSPVQATTTIDDDMDQNPELDSFTGSSDGGTAGFGSAPIPDPDPDPIGPEFVDIGPLGSNVEKRFGLPAEPRHIALSPSGDVGAIGGGGEVQIVRRSGDGWQKDETLSPADATNQFGSFTGTRGDTIAIGQNTLVVGDPDGVGKVYVFESQNGSFSKVYEFPNTSEGTGLLPSDVGAGSDLGSIVALNDTVQAGDSVFAAKFKTDLDELFESQHVTTFSKSGGSWGFEDDAEIEPSGNLLLHALGLGGSGVSAPTLVAGLSNIQGEFTGNNQGRVDVFELNGASFPGSSPTATLNPVSGKAFGRTVAIRGDTIAATTFDNLETYVYEEDGSSSYNQISDSPFSPSSAADGDVTAGVGLGEAGSEGFLLVGTPDDERNPPQTDTFLAGSVLLYRFDGSGSEEDDIIVSPTDVSVGFGNTVAVGGDSAFGLTQGQFGEGDRRSVANRVFAFDITAGTSSTTD